MRVLVVTRYDLRQSGGLASHVLELEREMRLRGLDVDVVAPRPSLVHRGLGRLRRIISGRSHMIMPSSLERSQSEICGIVSSYVAGRSYDLVHCQDVYSAVLPWDRLVGHACPVVLTVHGYALREAQSVGVASPELEESLLGLERRAYIASDRVIAVDTLIRDYVLSISRGQTRVVVVPNAVNVSYLRGCMISKEAATGALGIRQSAGPIMLVPRRLVPKNGVEYAIRAMPSILESLPGSVLMIAGAGPLLGELRHIAERLGIVSSVIFLGDIEHSKMVSIYSAADLTLIPSIPHRGVVEATSISALESMACGVPVIGSNIGGISEIIGGGVDCGVLVEPANPAAIAAGVRLLFSDPDRRRSIADAALARVLEKHDCVAWFDSIMSVYHEAMADRSPGGELG